MRIKVISSLYFTPQTKVEVCGCEFVFDQNCADYDWLVVFDEMPENGDSTYLRGYEPLQCPKANTILCTWEPVSIKSYSRAYANQFGHLLTNRPPEAERHAHYHLGRGYFPWFVHFFPKSCGAVEKTKTLSVMCSAKQMRHTKHGARFELARDLARSGLEVDWFGKGVRPLEKKDDALLPYRYHVVLENHIGARHWTEKLADAFLCECLPFYAGDPAIFEVFPEESLIPIPIDNPAEALRIICAAIERDEYSKRRDAVLEAKRRILQKYNFFAQVAAVVNETAPDAAGERGKSAAPDAAGERGESAAPVAAGERGKSAAPVANTKRIYARKTLRRRSVSAAVEELYLRIKRGIRL